MRENKTLYIVVVFVVILLLELKYEIITGVFGIQLSNLKNESYHILTIIYNIALVFLGLIFLHGSKPKYILKEIGALKKSIHPIIIVFIFSVAVIPLALVSQFCDCEHISLLGILIVVGLTIEGELVYRGFILSQLFRRASWGFLPAISIYPVLFTVKELILTTHFFNSIFQFIYILIFTLWLSWIYIEWNDNLWLTLVLHLAFRVPAYLFEADFAEIDADFTVVYLIQSLIVLFSVFITVKYAHPKSKRFRINSRNLIIQA